MSIKRILCLLIALLMLAAIGCSAESPASSEADPQPEETASLQEEPAPAPEEPAPAPEEASLSEEAKAAFIKVLSDLFYEYTLPDGEVSVPSETGRNDFTIADVDGDGRKELVFTHDPGVTAGQIAYILDYDEENQELYAELCIFPFYSIYDNGVVLALWSHNHDLCGETFWPFTMYCYNSEIDAFDMVADVTAWDGSFYETDYNGNPFPAELDGTDLGILYQINENEYIDSDEYSEWYSSYMDGSTALTLTMELLTEDAISALSAE